MTKRIYRLEHTLQHDGKPVTEIRLVTAATESAARNHIARPSITCRVATQTDLVECVKAGVEVEKA
jgi:hypothetical protein